MDEVVSCILATRNRPAFVRQAIRCFLRQTYDRSELIVVDDGDLSVADLCSGLYRVRYVRLNEPTSLGSKLNIGVHHARGTIIQKLDDDDYYHNGFLERAVSSLPAVEQECSLVAWDCFLIILAGEAKVRFSGHGWAAGGTLCFHRKLWERANFRDVPYAVDHWFLKDQQPRLIKVCAPELYILVRHGRNTWKTMHGREVDAYFQRLEVYHKPLDILVEPLDRLFYWPLTNGGGPP
jgi:glycosyltransferase involved in cell wall biosynthesis